MSAYLRLIKEALNIDIFDTTYVRSHASFTRRLRTGALNMPRKGYIVRVVSFCQRFLQSMPRTHMEERRKNKIPQGRIVFLAATKNENDSLEPVCGRTTDGILVRMGYRVDRRIEFPLATAYTVSLFFIPVVILRLLTSSGYKRNTFKYFLDQYCLAYGVYLVGRLWIQKVRARALVVANDDLPRIRVMLWAARDEGVTSFVLTHAAAPAHLPALVSDYALLEGVDSLQKYSEVGESNTKVYLIGVPKFDRYFRYINRHEMLRSVAVCTNQFDPLERTEEVCKAIRARIPAIRLLLRPHLNDPRIQDWRIMATKYDLEFSDCRSELSFDVMKRVDAVVAGESNILLDAALMNVTPLYYDFAESHFDWLGFERNGLVEYSSTPEELIEALNMLIWKRPPVRIKARRYCMTIGCKYDGRSAQLASKLILQLLAGDNEPNGWKRVPDRNLEAYEPTDSV